MQFPPSLSPSFSSVQEGMVRIHNAMSPIGDEAGEHVELGIGSKVKQLNPFRCCRLRAQLKGRLQDPKEGQLAGPPFQGSQNCDEISGHLCFLAAGGLGGWLRPFRAASDSGR